MEYERAAVALRRKGEAGEDILVAQIREFLEQLGLGRSSGKVTQDVVDGDPRVPNAGLTAPAAGLKGNALKEIHAPRTTDEAANCKPVKRVE